jgi:hypothetical protein
MEKIKIWIRPEMASTEVSSSPMVGGRSMTAWNVGGVLIFYLLALAKLGAGNQGAVL